MTKRAKRSRVTKAEREALARSEAVAERAEATIARGTALLHPAPLAAPPIVQDASGIYVRVPAAALPIVELARQGRDVADLGKAIAQGIEAFAETLGKLTAPKRRRRR